MLADRFKDFPKITGATRSTSRSSSNCLGLTDEKGRPAGHLRDREVDGRNDAAAADLFGAARDQRIGMLDGNDERLKGYKMIEVLW
jgi:hypothetical protein